MFDRHFRLYSRILFFADVVVFVPALYLAYHFRSVLVQIAPEEFLPKFNPILLPLSDYFGYVVVVLPVWVALLALTQRYDTVLRQSLSRQLQRVVYFLLGAGSFLGLASFTLKLEISRPIFFAFFAILVVALPLNRIFLHWVLRSRNISVHNQIRILVVGTDEKARRVGNLLEDSRKWGYHVVGYVREDGATAVDPDLVLGDIEDLPQLLEDHAVTDEVFFSGVSKSELEKYEGLLRLCEELGIRTRIAADFLPLCATAVSVEYLENLPLITFTAFPEQNLSLVVKRVLDFVVSVIGLIAVSPALLVIAVIIKLTSPGPVFYRQERCGLFGRRFALTKFRTMENGAEDRLWEIRHLNEMDGPVFKMRNDPRVTRFGAYLRKYSIDEIPQLWNVIKGEMSVVGPRAPLPEEVRHYSIPQRRRLSVRPGITCLWQVSGRSDVNFQKWMELDLQYIDNWSVWLDLRIMLKTVPAVFTGRGAR